MTLVQRFPLLLPTLLLMACGGAPTLDANEAREAMIKDQGLGFIDVCGAAMIDPSRQAECDEEEKKRAVAFRFELGECEWGAPETLEAIFGFLDEAMTCTVTWSSDSDPNTELRKSSVLFHRLEGELEAEHLSGVIR